MTTLEYPYRRTDTFGRTRIVMNPTIEIELSNPHVGEEFQEYLNGFSLDDSFVIAYLLEEYSEEIADELEDDDEDALREYVIDIEARRSGEDEQQQDKDNLSELVEDANAAEAKKMLEAAKEAKQEADVDDVHVHEEAVNRE